MSLRLLQKLTYRWLEILYSILFKIGINSRVCSYTWLLTLSICASGHSVETGWPSCVQFSQLSCPFEGDKWISWIMQVRSPGVKNWLFSHASTSVLPGCLCMLVPGVFTFDLVPQNVYSRETTYASQMQTSPTDACYTFKSFPLEASMQNDCPKHVSERQNSKSEEM